MTNYPPQVAPKNDAEPTEPSKPPEWFYFAVWALISTVVSLICSFAVYRSWNQAISPIFHLSPISFKQAGFLCSFVGVLGYQARLWPFLLRYRPEDWEKPEFQKLFEREKKLRGAIFSTWQNNAGNDSGEAQASESIGALTNEPEAAPLSPTARDAH
jgi:hypothetical protein